MVSRGVASHKKYGSVVYGASRLAYRHTGSDAHPEARGREVQRMWTAPWKPEH